jgi:hypothetical protein
MRTVQRRKRHQASRDRTEELHAGGSPAVQLALRSGRTEALARDGVAHLQRTAGNASVTRLLGVQRGRDKGRGVAVKGKEEAPAADVEVEALKRVLNKYDTSTELNADDGHAFKRSLSAAAGLPFKGHAPHGANFSKKQTLEAIVSNWWDGLHANTQNRFRPALDAKFGTGKF